MVGRNPARTGYPDPDSNAHSQPHTKPKSCADGKPDSNARTHCDCVTYTSSDSGAHAQPDAFAEPNAHPDPDAFAEPHCDCVTYASSDSNAHAHPDPESLTDTGAESNADAHADSGSNADANAYASSHDWRHESAQRQGWGLLLRVARYQRRHSAVSGDRKLGRFAARAHAQQLQRTNKWNPVEYGQVRIHRSGDRLWRRVGEPRLRAPDHQIDTRRAR